jgi:hypothetical protein
MHRQADMIGKFPWYDSWWLSRYVLAKAFIAQHHPAKLESFTGAMDALRTKPDWKTQLHGRLFTEGHVKTINAARSAIKPDTLELHELARHGRFVVHDHPMLTDLHAAMAPVVSALVGEPVEPIYTFIALYNGNGVCPVHLDAPVSKWTVDFCIDQSEPWPIAFSDVVPWPEEFDRGLAEWEHHIRMSSGLHFSPYSMEPGQAIVFSGSSQWHYRDAFAASAPKSHCDLLFLHFIPAGMKEASDWKNWERLFSIPGLTEAIRG